MPNIAAILSTIETVITLASQAIQAGKEAAPFAKALYDTFVNKDEVTEADLEELEARVDALHEELQAPLPPPTSDEE